MDAITEAGRSPESTGDSSVFRLPDRFQKRQQTRTEETERKKEAKASQSVAEEKSGYFFGVFNPERASIEELVSGCAGADRAAATLKLEEATAKMLQLQMFLNDSTLFLSKYDLRIAQAALKKLQASLAEAREEALPKKKFAFRARTRAAQEDTAPAPASESRDATETLGSGGAGVGVAGAPEQCCFSNIDNASLTKTAEEIQKRDVLLTHLTNCKVRLLGSPSTLHLNHIEGCEILCGPVGRSVFVDHCSNSTLAFACQQLRTHNTKDTQVYLHITCRPIIEDCHGVSFAPFSWSYPTLDEDFVESGLDRDQPNQWSQVDDFHWLAAGIPSPNWTVIPEADRRTTWDP